MSVFDLETLGVRVRFSRAHTVPHKKMAYLDHSHSYFELHMIEKGTCTFSAMGKRFDVPAGKVCMFAPGVVHSPKPGAPDVRRLCMEIEYLDTQEQTGLWLRRHAMRHPVWLGEGAAILCAVRELSKEQDISDGLSPLTEKSLLTLLVARLVRAVEDEIGAEAVQKREDMRMLRIDQFMNDRFSLSAGEEVLARELNLSRRQLDRVIQKQYGMSFRQKRSQVRLTVARDLLRSTDEPISCIAEELGYSSPSNFAVFFKSMEGMSPGEYRRQFKNVENQT